MMILPSTPHSASIFCGSSFSSGFADLAINSSLLQALFQRWIFSCRMTRVSAEWFVRIAAILPATRASVADQPSLPQAAESSHHPADRRHSAYSWSVAPLSDEPPVRCTPLATSREDT